MQTQFINIKQLDPNKGQIEGLPKNPRFIKDEKFQKLVRSIQDDPEMLELRECIVYPFDGKFVVIAGNMRLKALQELKYKEVPCKVLPIETTVEKLKAYTIKDNVGFGEHDWEALANEWDTAQLDAWGLDVPFVEEKEPEAKEDDFNMPEEIKTDIKPGDLFQIGDHRLLCGSSTEASNWKRIMDGAEADMVVTDPPYNVDYEGGTGLKIMNDKMEDGAFYQFLHDFHVALAEYTKPGGAWYVWHADSEGLNFRAAFKNSGLLLKQCLIWVKNALVMGRQDYQWKHEPCLYGWKPGAAHYFTDDRTQTTVIEDQVDLKKLTKKQLLDILMEAHSDKVPTTVINCDKPTRNDVHPTMKPILLLAPLIKNSSKAGEIVADGFLGSGSTMVASHQLNRKCYGMELDPKYCQVIVDRMIALDANLTITKNGKPYNPEVND